MAHDTVEVLELAICDFDCDKKAQYDGRTKLGPWAYMCQEHFEQHSVGLGLGKGQKLVLRGGD